MRVVEDESEGGAEAVPDMFLPLKTEEPLTARWNGFLHSVRDPNSSRRVEMPRPEDMWQCQTSNCGYIYNPDKGDRKGKIPKGTPFQELPEDWKCPVCGASTKSFRPLPGPGSAAEEGK